MAWLKVPHPPAGATTLIVSLGILRTPLDLAGLMAAVVLLVVQGFVINRVAASTTRPGAPGLSPRKARVCWELMNTGGRFAGAVPDVIPPAP
ncbi:MAG TPA: HPP family protein [Nitriliruptorales bacterium]|nr:HPP family protein [Nitriliruptorales bacterium]